MAYFSSDAPLPQNSLDPPPAWKVAASNTRLYQNAQASRTGRERVYADLPDVESFLSEGAGLTVDAAYIIPASELARRSVLNGLSPLGADSNATAAGATSPTGQPIYGQAPQVFSLNAPSAQAIGASPATSSQSMPQAAPVPTQYGYFKAAEGPALPVRKFPTVIQPGGELACQQRGVSGYAPPWSDAFAIVAGKCPSGSGGNKAMPWVVLAILGAGLVGLTQAGKRGRF